MAGQFCSISFCVLALVASVSTAVADADRLRGNPRATPSHPIAGFGQVRFVDDDAAPGGDGATWASAQWLNGGSITIRSGEAQGARPDSGQVVGQITAEQALFYPLCIAWGLLGVTMIALAGLAFVRKSPLLGKFSAYACAGLLLLVFTTLLATWLLKP